MEISRGELISVFTEWHADAVENKDQYNTLEETDPVQQADHFLFLLSKQKGETNGNTKNNR